MMNDASTNPTIIKYTNVEPDSALGISPTTASSESTVHAYNARLSALTIIKQLTHLCRDTQKHRGLGMGLLAGNDHFAERFNVLQQQMARRVVLLTAFAKESDNPLTASDIDKIENAWETIRAGWHDDSVLENFQFHSHFIEQLLMMVMRIAECLKKPFAQHAVESLMDSESDGENGIVIGAGVESEPESMAQSFVGLDEGEQPVSKDVLHFVCYQVPQMIEFLGKVRALSTHAATVGYSIDEHSKKLHYFCQCVKTKKIKVMAAVQKLNAQMGNEIPSLLVMKTYEFKLDALIEKISNQVVGQKKIKASSDDLFDKTTEVIDVYWRVVDDGLDVLHAWQEQALEQWCLEG